MDDMMRLFQAQTAQILTESEAKMLRLDRNVNRDRLEKLVQEGIVSYNDPGEPRTLVKKQGKESDSEIDFYFEDREDAEDMYQFFVTNRLLEPGEILLRIVEGQNLVSFQPSVVVQKPELIQAALIAYEDQLALESEDDAKGLDALVEAVNTFLDEANVVAGAPKRKFGMGNPFHDPDTGRLTGAKELAAKGGGSWAIGKTKLKFTGANKAKNGNTVIKFGSTKHPCGRADRPAPPGGSIRCWDGKEGAGTRIGAAMGKMKRTRRESLSFADLSYIMEIRSKYSR